jgi:hypothetical protein
MVFSTSSFLFGYKNIAELKLQGRRCRPAKVDEGEDR